MKFILHSIMLNEIYLLDIVFILGISLIWYFHSQ